MKLVHHGILSIALAGAAALYTGSAADGASCFAAGTLLDVDHLYDYLRFPSRKNNWRDFIDVCENRRLHRLFLFLHSWELAIVLAMVCRWPDASPGLCGLALGVTSHLAADQVANPVRLPAYWLLYRWYNGFSGRAFFSSRPAGGV